MEIRIRPDDLNLDFTLGCGQAFRWKKDEDGRWTGVVRSRFIRLRQWDERIECEVVPEDGWEELLRSYFRLDDDLSAIRRELAERDGHLGDLLRRFAGLRLLRQEPTETLLSFICSTANSIPRIQNAIETLASNFGRRICVLEDVCCYEFPEPAALAAQDGRTLAKVAGLGFRGEKMKCVAAQLLEKPPGWLDSLAELSYHEAKRELVRMDCIGEKIADCVCLFALGKNDAVPVDTHIRQLACRLYGVDLACKTVTSAAYRRISTFFREHFGKYAGWAQQYLYYEDLVRGSRIG